jgi:hypothetical protein
MALLEDQDPVLLLCESYCLVPRTRELPLVVIPKADISFNGKLMPPPQSKRPTPTTPPSTLQTPSSSPRSTNPQQVGT